MRKFLIFIILVGGSIYFLGQLIPFTNGVPEESESQRAASDNAVRWLRNHYRTYLDGGWSLIGVHQDGSNFMVEIKVPAHQAASFIEMPSSRRMAIYAQTCPNAQEEIWGMLRSGQSIRINVFSDQYGQFGNTGC